MRIVQLTDLHLPPAGTDTQLRIDTRQNFLDMLPRVVALQPDLIVLSGDLCYDVPEAATFNWVREQMDALEISYAVIAGNHDDSTQMGEAFDLTIQQKEVYFEKALDQQVILFLDTALATISDAQLEWLDEQLTNLEGPVLIFMHHPPLPAGMPFMDNHWPFHRSAELMALFNRYASNMYVFCGHYHTERVVHAGNVSTHITPSLYFQLDPEKAEPSIEHTSIALRVIDFKEGQLYTAVQYFEGHTTKP